VAMNREIRSIDLDAVFADAQTAQGAVEPRAAQTVEAAIPSQSIGMDQLVPLLVAFMEDRNNRPPAPTIVTTRSHERQDRRMGLGGVIAGVVAVAAITGGAMYVLDKDVREAVKDRMGIPSEQEAELTSGGGGGSGRVIYSLVGEGEIGSDSVEPCELSSGVRVCVKAIDNITTQNERNEPESALLLDLALYDINGNKITDPVESEIMLEELLADDDFYIEFNQYLCERTGYRDQQLVAYLFHNQSAPQKAGRLGNCNG
jgi:hypothetical protein